MKRLVIFLNVICIICGCTKITSNGPETGQYIATGDNYVVSMNVNLSGEGVVGITVFFNGKFTYQDLYGHSSGTYPNMVYTFSRKEILILNCTFNSSSMFTAVSESDKLPHKLIFNRDDVVLDINGDGEIDGM